MRLVDKIISIFIILNSSQWAFAEIPCKPSIHAPVPPLGELPYKKARILLIEQGWQPSSFHYEHIQDTAYEYTAKSLVDYGWHEVKQCSGTGKANCLMYFSDVYGNVLKILTEGEFINDAELLKRLPLVRSAKFVCN